MSKPFKHILLPAKELGWELWQVNKGAWKLVKPIPQIDKSSAIPKDARIALPSSVVTTVPLVIPSADHTVKKGVAQLQMEHSGVVKSGSASWDLYLVDSANSLSTGVSLIEGSIDEVNHLLEQTFDLAARFYKVGDIDTILCKREQGSWVTIFYKESRPFYTEITDSLASLSSQIKVLLIQFAEQGIDFTPEVLTVENDADWGDENEHLIENLGKDLGVTTQSIETVNFAEHGTADLQLVPSLILKSRQKKKRNKTLKLYAMVCVCIYAVGCMFLFKQYKQRETEIEETREEIAALQPEWIAYQQNLAKMNELNDLLTNQWPLASFEKVLSHLPKKQELRFQEIELQSEVISIRGASPNVDLINLLVQALEKDSYFKEYTWKKPTKAKNRSTGLWNFTIEAIKKGGE